MKTTASRRDFLAAGFALPAASLNPLSAPAAAAKVQYRKLGRTGVQISTLGFGCMVTSDPSVITRAVDMGINHFDTARVYQGGNNEPMVGAALKPYRQKVIISSKTKGQDKAAALKHLEESLQALKTDYLDVWYLHDKRTGSDIKDDLIEAQALAKQQGKIRYPGISMHSGHADIVPAIVKSGKFDVVLMTYNFATGDKWAPQIKSLADAGMGVIAMKVMAGSFGMDPSYDYKKSRETLKRAGAPLAALKWVLQNPNVSCAIPSITDADQLLENSRAMAEPYTDKDKQVLAAQLEHIRPLYCRTCGDCAGACPKGYPVSDVLRYLSYAEGYGEYALGRENFLAMPAGMQAVRCGECTSCAVSCPNGVRVTERLIRAQEIFA